MNRNQRNLVDRYYPCDAGYAWWTEQTSPEMAWITCNRQDWITWYIVRHRVKNLPATLEILRVACRLIDAPISTELENRAIEAMNYYYKTPADIYDNGESSRRALRESILSRNGILPYHRVYSEFIRQVISGNTPLGIAVRTGYYACLTPSYDTNDGVYTSSIGRVGKFIPLVKSIIPLHSLNQ